MESVIKNIMGKSLKKLSEGVYRVGKVCYFMEVTSNFEAIRKEVDAMTNTNHQIKSICRKDKGRSHLSICIGI